MIAGIEKKVFMGSTDNKGKNPLYSLNILDNNNFRTAGEVMAASMAQGGPLPNFLREWCYWYLCKHRCQAYNGDEQSDWWEHCWSYWWRTKLWYIGTVYVDKSDQIISLSGVRTIVLHSTMRVVPIPDQLRKGLQLYDLQEVLKTHLSATICARGRW